MALSSLRLNLDDASGPGRTGEILIRPVSSSFNTAAWTSIRPARIPLSYSDPAHASTDPGYAPNYTILDGTKYPQVTQGAQYEFTVVRVNQTKDGSVFTATIPATSSVDFDDLVPTIPVPSPPAVTYTQAQLDTFLGGKTDLSPTGREQLATQDYVKLRPLFYALEQRETTPVNIGFMGPSTVEGYLTAWSTTPSQAMQRRLRQRFPISGLGPSQGGTGIIPIPSGPVRGVGATASPTTTPWSFSGSMQFDETAFSSGVTHTIAYTNGAEYGQITTDRDLTSIKVNHLAGTSGGVAAAYIRADALTAVTFNTNAGVITVKEDSFTAVQLGFPGGIIPTGTVIKVGGMSTGAYLILSHIEGYYNDTTKGIRVHNIGHSGFDTQDWLQTVAGGATMATIAGLSLSHLLLDFFGINAGSTGRSYASGGSRTAAQWKAEMVAFIAALRTAGINCNITLIASYDPTGGIALTSSWQSYVTAMREIATADATISFYDHSLRMPATGATTTYGYYAADKVHLTATGNTKIAAGITEYLLQTMDTGPLGDALPYKADLVSGKIPVSELGTGATGAGTYYLADDQTFKPLSGIATPTATTTALAAKMPLPNWTTGLWYESQYLGVSTSTTSAPTLNTIHYDLIYVPNSITVSQIGTRAAGTNASMSFNLGIYASSSSGGAPAARLLTATIAAPTAGVYTVSAGSLALTPGFYWVALQVTGATATIPVRGGGGAIGYRGETTAIASSTVNPSVGYMQTGLTSLPTTATPVAASSTEQSRPRVALLVA